MRILQRYVMIELIKVFALALVAFTALFVLGEVAEQALKQGIGIAQVAALVPLVIPGTLPYTVPATILLAVTVVYGRLAADNEILACKSAGISVVSLIYPAWLLGLILSVCLLYVADYVAPTSHSRIRRAALKNVEDVIYAMLRSEQQLKCGRELPYEIYVMDVQGRVLKDVCIKRKDGPNSYSTALWADEATLSFDSATRELHFHVLRPHFHVLGPRNSDARRGVSFHGADEQTFIVPLPELGTPQNKSPRELTPRAFQEEEEFLQGIRDSMLQHTVFKTAVSLASGRLETMPWHDMVNLAGEHERTTRVVRRYECEPYLRRAISFGCLFFVALGCPVAILFQRGDFLSAFISCFLPIIGLYYPLVMFGLNFAKEGVFPPQVLYSGNLILFLASLLFYRPVLRH